MDKQKRIRCSIECGTPTRGIQHLQLSAADLLGRQEQICNPKPQLPVNRCLYLCFLHDSSWGQGELRSATLLMAGPSARPRDLAAVLWETARRRCRGYLGYLG